MDKKKCFLLVFTSFIFFNCAQAQIKQGVVFDTSKLNRTHDILLSPWGPYSSKYAGISHIKEIQSGIRLDFTVLPAIHNSKTVVPNVIRQSGYYPWIVNDDLTKYTYRNELEWKDKTYVDVTYHIIDSATTLVKMSCVNNTALPQNMELDLISFINYPSGYPSKSILSSDSSLWKNALEYNSLAFAQQRPTDNLVYDGWLRGEILDSVYLNGRAVGRYFGRDKGDKITYQFNINKEQLKGNLAILYKMESKEQGTFRLSGMINHDVTLSGTGDLTWKVIPYNISNEGYNTLTLESAGNSETILNGFMILAPGKNPESFINSQNENLTPEKIESVDSCYLILKYKDIPAYYGIKWELDRFKFREIRNDQLETFFQDQIGRNNITFFRGNNKGNYTDISMGPVALAAYEVKSVYAMLCTGYLNEVKQRLMALPALKRQVIADGNIADDNRPVLNDNVPGILPEGNKYVFATQQLSNNLMTNISYPLYTQNSYVRGYVPGKWWNMLYTWDAGFSALGLTEINPKLAAECINAYTTPVGSQSAFIHHGTPVPTQIYAFFSLWNKTQSKELLAYFYPRLKQYYLFLAGRLGSSTTRKFKSGLLNTWDYFYNAGGWDDYPAQVAVHRQKEENSVAPVAPTAHAIRVAKMLRMAAEFLRKKKDIDMFEQDIKAFSNALQNFSWDSEIGYFSYVVHNDDGLPTGYFIDSTGANLNMGLGGAYPLVSGICNPDQQNKLTEKIFSSQHLWTSAGISVVDQSAPYYKIGGYWNGTVWMPHQWFFWKSLLDIGRPDLAFRIADKALSIFKTETDATYYTFEHYSAKNGRGGGWHQFSALTCPVLNWFSAYYKIGTVTTGFEIWINNQSFNADHSDYEANISFDDATPAHTRTMLVCMSPDYKYHVSFDGKRLPVNTAYNGMIEITFPKTNKTGVLKINHL